MPPGDVIAGQKLAEQSCAACHFVKKGVRDFSPNSAPSFQLVADDPAVTALSLRVFFRTPHQFMPDFILNDEQADDVISYILSLK